MTIYEFFLYMDATNVSSNGIICKISKTAPISKNIKERVRLSLKISDTAHFNPFSLIISATIHKAIPQAKTIPYADVQHNKNNSKTYKNGLSFLLLKK